MDKVKHFLKFIDGKTFRTKTFDFKFEGVRGGEPSDVKVRTILINGGLSVHIKKWFYKDRDYRKRFDKSDISKYLEKILKDYYNIEAKVGVWVDQYAINFTDETEPVLSEQVEGNKLSLLKKFAELFNKTHQSITVATLYKSNYCDTTFPTRITKISVIRDRWDDLKYIFHVRLGLGKSRKKTIRGRDLSNSSIGNEFESIARDIERKMMESTDARYFGLKNIDFKVECYASDSHEFINIDEMKKIRKEQTTSGSSGAVETPANNKIIKRKGVYNLHGAEADPATDATGGDTVMESDVEFSDGAAMDDYAKPLRKQVRGSMPHTMTVGQLKRLLNSLADHFPEIYDFAYAKMDEFCDESGTISDPMQAALYARTLMEFLGKMDISVSPNFEAVPHPELNESSVDDIPELDLSEVDEVEGDEELEEATDSGSSGSYETPGCWATGTGKESIKNSRAQKSAQFKKNLLGGPKAQYVSIPGSVNTVSEQVLDYFRNPSVQQVVKKVSKKYGLKESTVTSLLMKQIFIKK